MVQRDAAQSSLFIILQVHSTCFGYQPHLSPGVHKTVTTAPGTCHIFMQLPSSNVANLAALEGGSCTIPEAVVTVLCTPDWPCWREVAAQKIWPVPEAVVAVLCTPNWPRWREVAAQKNMTITGGCSYSSVYTWWWVWLEPETFKVNLQNYK